MFKQKNPIDDLENFSTVDSWVELQPPPSRGSLSSSVDALLQIDPVAAGKVTSNRGSRHSPKSLQSPNVEMLDSCLEEVMKQRLAKEILPPGKHTDWLWDWSSRPEVQPPINLGARRVRSSTNPTNQQAATGGQSALTTPPNSPVPERPDMWMSLRHKSLLVKSPLFRADVILGLVVSNIVTFLLGACLGYYMCKQIQEAPPRDIGAIIYEYRI